MPGSGVNLLWDETNPADSANAGAGAGAIRSIETTLRNGLQQEHNWPNTTGPNFGYHLFGSARAYYGLESAVSSSGTDGRLMVASDTSRLFHVGSNGTMLLGAAASLQAGGGNLPGFGDQKTYWALESGAGVTDASGALAIVFPNSGFSGAPQIWAQLAASAVTGVQNAYLLIANGVSQTTATIASYTQNTLNVRPGVPLTWFSYGSRVL